jgi:hypothetical protein
LRNSKKPSKKALEPKPQPSQELTQEPVKKEISLYSCWKYQNKHGLVILFQIEKLVPRVEARAVIFSKSHPELITLGEEDSTYKHFYCPAPYEIAEAEEITYNQFWATWILVADRK